MVFKKEREKSGINENNSEEFIEKRLENNFHFKLFEILDLPLSI